MDPRKHILLRLLHVDGNALPRVDVPDLLLHLMLFDKVTVRSSRLLELSQVAREIGPSQLSTLLKSGRLRIKLDLDTITVSNEDSNVVDVGHMSTADFESHLSNSLRELSSIGAGKAELKRLKLDIVDACEQPPADYRFQDSLNYARRVAQENGSQLNDAIRLSFGNRGIRDVPSIEFRSSSDLLSFDVSKTDIPPALLRDAVRRAVLALAAMHYEFELMRRHEAVIVMETSSSALLESHMKVIYERAQPGIEVKQFHRVLDVAGLPEFSTSMDGNGIDIDALLRLRDLSETQEFCDFLRTACDSSDEEIRSRVASWKAKLGSRLQSTVGKTLRILATTGLGAIVAGPPGVVVGFAIDTVDAFLIDSILPKSGVFTFLDSRYKSLFS